MLLQRNPDKSFSFALARTDDHTRVPTELYALSVTLRGAYDAVTPHARIRFRRLGGAWTHFGADMTLRVQESTRTTSFVAFR